MVDVVHLKPLNCPNKNFSSSEDELRDTCVSQTSVAHSLGTKHRKIETLGTLGFQPKKRRNTSFQTESKKSFGRKRRKIETLGTLGTEANKIIPSFQSKMKTIRRLQSKLLKAIRKIHSDSDLSDEASNSSSQDELFHDAVTSDEDSESSHYSTPETRNSDGNYNLIENILMSICV